MAKEKKLTRKQQLFCEEYVKDFNGARAARDAGYSVHTARTIADELLTQPDIKSLVGELTEARFKDVQINAGELLREIYSMAMVDPVDAYGDDGELLSIPDMPPSIRKMIANFEVVELFEGSGKDKTHVGYTKKVKFYDRSKAIDMLAKHLALYVERVEHTHKLDLPSLVLGSFDNKDKQIDNAKDITPSGEATANVIREVTTTTRDK